MKELDIRFFLSLLHTYIEWCKDNDLAELTSIFGVYLTESFFSGFQPSSPAKTVSIS